MTARKPKTARLAIKNLVFDENLYPRNSTDPVNVGRLTQRIRMGVAIDPIVVWAGTNKVVDGWHRCEAYASIYTDEYELLVEVREYKSEADALEDAIRINNKHGQYLTSTDLSIAWYRLSQADPMYPPERFQEMTGQTPRVFDRNVDRVVPVSDGTVAVIKRGFMVPEDNKPLTPLEAKGIHAAGRSLGSSVRALISILDNAGGLIDVERFGLLDSIRELHEKLGRFLEKYQKAAPIEAGRS